MTATSFKCRPLPAWPRSGAVWAPCRKLEEQWHFIKGMTAPEVAALVREKGVDVLVDLSSHTAGNRLDVFALKPAPVSVSWT